MNPFSILIWNARGLNQKDRWNSVRETILSSNADIVCLQETKVADMSQRLFLSVFGTAFDKFIALPADGTRGGVLIAWKGCSCQAIATRVDSYSVSVLFAEQDGRNWWFTGVYGPQGDDEKVLFLQELRNIHAQCNGPWLVAGDFTLIYQAADKNNTNLYRAMMGRFRCFLDDMEVKEIPLFGRKYTWSNERRSPTLVRLDRAFCCVEWECIFPDSVLQSTTAGVSDHCPLILGLKVCTGGNRRFHFENFWTKVPGFLDAVKQNSEAPVRSNCAVERLFLKLQRLSKGLKNGDRGRSGTSKPNLGWPKRSSIDLKLRETLGCCLKTKSGCAGSSSSIVLVWPLWSVQSPGCVLEFYTSKREALIQLSFISKPGSGRRRILFPNCRMVIN